MRNKILNCQNFAFHNATLWFSHHALSAFISPPRELTDAHRYLDHFFLKQLAFCKNNRNVEFLKISSPRAEDSAKSKARRAEAKDLGCQGHPRGLHH